MRALNRYIYCLFVIGLVYSGDADHLIFGPSVKTLVELNKLCFKIMGDMNWHAHCGIYTYPFQIAVKFKIPLLIWGETFWDISGMYDVNDMVEYTGIDLNYDMNTGNHEQDCSHFKVHDTRIR